MQQTVQQSIDNLKAQIVEIQVRIAETREKGSEWAEGTRLAEIAELRECIAFFEANRDKPASWWDADIKVGA